MKKVRIIKRTSLDGTVRYVIQQKHFIFRWIWVDAWLNALDSSCNDRFKTLEEAKQNLCYFDDSKPKTEVVYKNYEGLNE